MSINVIISLSFFDRIGFVIIPIATSASTWAGVLVYTYLLNENKFLLLKEYLLKNVLKIILCTFLMTLTLLGFLEYFALYLDYSYKYKSVYLLLIVGFVTGFYLILCYLTGVLKTKNFKTN